MKTIKEIQEKLDELGYGPLTFDGINGPKTKQAIKDFQRDNDLPQDGIFGVNTERLLFPKREIILRDYITMNRVKNLHPKVRDEVMELLERVESGFPKNMAVRVVQGLRTIDEQNELYKLGRTKVNPDGKTAKKPMGNKVTNAVGGKSYHNYGLAIDFAILKDKDNNGTYETLSWSLTDDYDQDGKRDWMEVVSVFKAAGWEWGGDWTSIVDNPHFQKTFGYKVGTLLSLYNNPSKRIPGTPYVNI